MRLKLSITILALFILSLKGMAQQVICHFAFDFYGDPVSFTYDLSQPPAISGDPDLEKIKSFYSTVRNTDYHSIIQSLEQYKLQHNPDDWLYYQLIRKTAQQIAPKQENYNLYTLYKWFLLCQTGYDALLAASNQYLLFYVQSDEKIYNIPYRMRNDKQYVCLNYHDYGQIDFENERFTEVALPANNGAKPFSYKVTTLPDFSTAAYEEKDLSFNFYQTEYHFKLKVNPQVKAIFINYPVVDYESYFNIPLSKAAYQSLIPALKKNISDMKVREGVDYLMRFTRYAFLFQPDAKVFGKEKRLSPEQTLLYNESDCDDRAALFFYLVKEIYDLPMIVLDYPKHVTIAVKFDKPVGHAITYKGEQYSICEPTPQSTDLRVGQLLPSLKKEPFEVVYAYHPANK